MRVPQRPADKGHQVHTANSGGDGTRFGIRAGLLIPGRGEPIKNGALVVDGDKIAWVGEHDKLPFEYAELPITSVPVVLPGLWDVHTHFMGADAVAPLTDSFKQFLPDTEALIGAVTVADLEATLMAGFTSVREVGGYAGAVYPAVEKGLIVGPNVYSSFAVLSITGGHGDVHDVPWQTVMEGCSHGGWNAVCDGVDACVATVRKTIRRGARVIKICSTGGVLSLNDQPEHSQFSDAELRAIVEEAARSGRVVCAHAIGKEGIMAALRAGVKSIEHGFFLDAEVAALMREKDAVLVPTRHIVECLADRPDALPPSVRAKLERMLQHSRESLRFAIGAGVKVALGTDTYSSSRGEACSHGKNAMELWHAVEAGMTPLQAIEMGTAAAPETLGPQAPRSGQLRAGYDADIIAVCGGDPLDDIAVLTKPRNVSHVWKGGRLFKSPAPADV